MYNYDKVLFIVLESNLNISVR